MILKTGIKRLLALAVMVPSSGFFNLALLCKIISNGLRILYASQYWFYALKRAMQSEGIWKQSHFQFDDSFGLHPRCHGDSYAQLIYAGTCVLKITVVLFLVTRVEVFFINNRYFNPHCEP